MSTYVFNLVFECIRTDLDDDRSQNLGADVYAYSMVSVLRGGGAHFLVTRRVNIWDAYTNHFVEKTVF